MATYVTVWWEPLQDANLCPFLTQITVSPSDSDFCISSWLRFPRPLLTHIFVSSPVIAPTWTVLIIDQLNKTRFTKTLVWSVEYGINKTENFTSMKTLNYNCFPPLARDELTEYWWISSLLWVTIIFRETTDMIKAIYCYLLEVRVMW